MEVLNGLLEQTPGSTENCLHICFRRHIWITIVAGMNCTFVLRIECAAFLFFLLPFVYRCEGNMKEDQGGA